jgi:hypothetical protein
MMVNRRRPRVTTPKIVSEVSCTGWGRVLSKKIREESRTAMMMDTRTARFSPSKKERIPKVPNPRKSALPMRLMIRFICNNPNELILPESS